MLAGRSDWWRRMDSRPEFHLHHQRQQQASLLLHSSSSSSSHLDTRYNSIRGREAGWPNRPQERLLHHFFYLLSNFQLIMETPHSIKVLSASGNWRQDWKMCMQWNVLGQQQKMDAIYMSIQTLLHQSWNFSIMSIFWPKKQQLFQERFLEVEGGLLSTSITNESVDSFLPSSSSSSSSSSSQSRWLPCWCTKQQKLSLQNGISSFSYLPTTVSLLMPTGGTYRVS